MAHELFITFNTTCFRYINKIQGTNSLNRDAKNHV